MSSLLDLPQAGRYGIIYADPPAHFKVRSAKGAGRSASRHYLTMTKAEILALPVAQIAAPDCVLFLWATDPMLKQALETIEAWGFAYKTVGFYWAKLNRSGKGYFMGGGYWTRANPEQCLLATRGSPKRVSKAVRRLHISPRREHSRKADGIRTDIVDLCGDIPRVELFARTEIEGWDSWGIETGKFSP